VTTEPELLPIAKFLPRVHPDAAHVSRVAFDARFQKWLSRLSGRTDISVVRRLPPDDGMLLDIEAAHGNVHLAVETRDWPALEMALTMEDESASCAVASALLTPWLSMLGQALGAPRVARRTRFAAGRNTDSCAVIATAAARVSMLRITPALREAMHARLAGIASGASRSLAALTLRPRLRLLERSLPATVLAALEPGDIALLEGAASTSIPVTLIIGKGTTMQVEATYDPDTGQAVATGEPAMRTEREGPDDAAALEELQVPVSFEVDTARITLGELAGIRPGYVIELEKPVTAATVRLVCHGQTVGHGQLVAVGEQMGIRIVRMGLAAPGAGAQGSAE